MRKGSYLSWNETGEAKKLIQSVLEEERRLDMMAPPENIPVESFSSSAAPESLSQLENTNFSENNEKVVAPQKHAFLEPIGNETASFGHLDLERGPSSARHMLQGSNSLNQLHSDHNNSDFDL